MAETEHAITRMHYQPIPMSGRLLHELRTVISDAPELPDQKLVRGFAYGPTQFGDGKPNPNNPDDFEQMMEHIRNGRR